MTLKRAATSLAPIRTVRISDVTISNLTLKQAALARTAPPAIGTARYHPSDQLLAFLENL